MPTFSMPLNLGGLTFKQSADTTIATGTLTNGSIEAGAYLDGSKDLLGGDDVLRSSATLQITTPGADTFSALRIGGSLATSDGSDTVKGSVAATFGDAASWTLSGIESGLGSTIALGVGANALRGDVNVSGGANLGGDFSGLKLLGAVTAGSGADLIEGIAKATASSASGDGLRINGILGGGTIFTGAGGDTVRAQAVFDNAAAADGWIVTSAFKDIALDTGDGADRVTGLATVVAGTTNVEAYAVNHGTIATGAGADEIVLKGQASQVYAVLEATIDTGTGGDWLKIDAVGGTFGVASAFSTILLGDGDDTAVLTASGRNYADGTSSGLIDAGAGSDTLRALVTVTEANRNGGAAGFDGTDIRLGSGDDTLIATATSISRYASGLLRVTLDGGEGSDTVKVAGNGAYLHNEGVSLSTIDLGGGDDRLDASAIGTAGGSGRGISESTILMGAGDDEVFARGSAENVNRANGIFQSTIDLGSGYDVLRAVSNNGHGMLGATVYGGADDDYIYARGLVTGIVDTHLFGGTGNDTFDIHSGQGDIHGDGGRDLLILTGSMSDYTFDADALGPGGFDVRIIDKATGANVLDVYDVERFQFGNKVVSFADLFG